MTEIVEKLHYDESEDRLIIEQVQDVQPILEANKRALNESEGKFHSEVFNKVASIPETLALKWCREKGITYQEFLANPKVLMRFLQDPDMKKCLTTTAKL